MKTLKYIFINLLFATLLWLGIVEKIEGAANVAFVWAWLTICISPLLCADKIIETMRKRRRCVPDWIDISFDLAIVVFMIWNSWLITGVGYFIHMLFLAVAHKKAYTKETNNAPQ